MSLEIHDLRYAHPGSKRGIHLSEFALAQGETLAVVGPSGTGKTTFLNLLAALVRPDSGKIRVNDFAVENLGNLQAQAYRARSVGYIFQDFGLLEYLDARDNILHPFRIARGRRITPEIRRTVDARAMELGLTDRLNHHPAQLSHGERQRVAICRAILTEPEVILADEPTGNLDPETAAQIMDHLLAVRARLGATFIMVTHDHGLLDRFDRVLDFRHLWGDLA